MTDPVPRRLTWTTYLFMACEGYLIYAVGFITPYVETELGVPHWMAVLPNSTVAIGIMLGSAVAGRALARLGPTVTVRLWAVMMAASGALLAVPVSLVPILLGALVFGIAVAGLLVHANSALAGRRNGVLLVRSNLWSVVGGVIAPLALSAAARTVGWNLGVLLAAPVLIALAVVLPGSPARDATDDGLDERPLGRPYWLAWTYLALCIGAEFSFVAWGAQVAGRQAGLTVADATALASMFVLGMVAGRALLTGPIGARAPVALLLRGCTLLAAAGALLLWVAPVPVLAGLGLFLGGLGIAPMYPFGATLALAHAPLAPVRASARLTAASGLAIIVAPLVLGIVAGVTGVVGAWSLVPVLLAVALVVLLNVPKPAATPTG